MNQLSFRNGDKIDAIGLGTWKSKPGEVYKAVREAIKAGYIILIVLGFTKTKMKLAMLSKMHLQMETLPEKSYLLLQNYGTLFMLPKMLKKLSENR